DTVIDAPAANVEFTAGAPDIENGTAGPDTDDTVNAADPEFATVNVRTDEPPTATDPNANDAGDTDNCPAAGGCGGGGAPVPPTVPEKFGIMGRSVRPPVDAVNPTSGLAGTVTAASSVAVAAWSRKTVTRFAVTFTSTWWVAFLNTPMVVAVWA